MTDQLSLEELLPDTGPPEVTIERLPLDAIVADWDQSGPRASGDLVRSIERHGVLQPILVERTDQYNEDSPARYRVIDGRRRLDAAWRAEIPEIPAVIVEQTSGLAPPVMTLTTNAQRSANPVAEFIAIQSLMHAGASESMIAKVTGMAVATIRKRMRLQKLTPALRERLAQGELSVSAAEAATKLTTKQQEALLDFVGEEGKVTAEMVREAREVGAEATNTAFDPSVFRPEGDTPPPEWCERVLTLLDEITDVVPKDHWALATVSVLRKELVRYERDKEVPDDEPGHDGGDLPDGGDDHDHGAVLSDDHLG